MKARLLALVVDLLLDCFALLIGPDKSPGIAVSTIPELAAALMREGSVVTYPIVPENERHVLNPSLPTVNVKVVLPHSTASRSTQPPPATASSFS